MDSRLQKEGHIDSWLLLFACLAVAAVVGQSEIFGAYGSLAHGREFGGFDINAVWAAGRRIIGGLSPYTAEALGEYRSRFGPGAIAYPYPPFENVIVAPLGLLSMGHAAALVFLLNVAAYAGSGFLLARRLIRENPAYHLLFLFAALLAASDGMRTIYASGNLAVVTLFLALWASDILDSNRPGSQVFAGVLLGLAALVKFYLAILAIPLLLYRKWGALAAMAGVLTVSAVLSVILFPLSFWVDWIQQVAPSAAYGTGGASSFTAQVDINQSLNGFLLRLIGATVLQKVLAGLGAVAILLFSVRQAWARRNDAAGFFPALSLFLVAMVLIAPLSWDHYSIYCLPVLTAAFCAIAKQRPNAWICLGIAALGFVPWGALIKVTARQPFVSSETLFFLCLWAAAMWLSASSGKAPNDKAL